MNNWKLRSVITGTNTDDLVEVNGYLAAPSTTDVPVLVVPFGDQYAASLRTSASDTFGPVSNQVPGICNGTFTHTTSANGQVASTTLTGNGSGATFSYGFIADGTLSFIRAATAGSNYKVGDKLQITTNQGHVIQFRLVDGSNSTSLGVTIPHDRNAPLPYAVHRARVNSASEYTFHVYDYRSSQVFPRPQDKLLDKYPDAAAAYGLRLLRSAYLGPAIRVRRESTGWPEIDIHFDAQGNLDTKALLDFAGTSSVRVVTWYDQSGNVRNAGQSTNAAQPTIVNGGVLVTVNGKPALEFDGSDDTLFAGHDGLYGQDRFDAYLHYQTSQARYIMFEDPDSDGRYSFVPADTQTDQTTLEGNYDIDGTSPTLYVNGVQSNLVDGTDNRDELHTVMVTNGAAHSNGAVVVHEAAGTQDWTDFAIGTYTSYQFDGKLTEIVIYTTDQSANRENIEKDMALHSGAYQVEDAPLLDAYGGAHAAYSLRKLNSDYTGAAIRVRRNDASEQDIGFDSNGNLDTTAMQAFTSEALFIKTWYDQSGNGNDITQTTTGAQPLVLNALGAVIEVDGRPAASFGGNDELPFDATGLDIGNLSSFVVTKMADTSATQFVLRASGIANNKRWFAPLVQSGVFRYMHGVYHTDVGTTGNTNNNLHTMIAGATQGDVEAFLNGTSVGTRTLDTGIDTTITGIGGAGNLTNFMNGFVQEVIVYSSDQSERREGIERNISNHYDL